MTPRLSTALLRTQSDNRLLELVHPVDPASADESTGEGYGEYGPHRPSGRS